MSLVATLSTRFRRRSLLIPTVALTGTLMFPAYVTGATPQAISKRIDQFVEAGYEKNNLKPNPPTGDEVFLRRIYLDIAGRIPTHEEAVAFLDSEGRNRRGRLINQLLDSEAHVSHFYNYWADILRLKSRMDGESGEAYAQWLKQAVRENKPYNEFVYELVTADGQVWENGAVGYYLRDSGMPLDNMSNTAQVFLGTQLVCAQCHNHPFDKWKQMDYYQMAAYTYGVETRINPERIVGIEKIEDRRKRRRSYSGIDSHMRDALGDILRPLSYGVHEREKPRTLHLPKDYQYKDADPNEAVRPSTPFGKKARSNRKPRENYAQWMTSLENPRFTKVISNRLWKRVMGVGLIEPVDDIRDGTEASHPKLLAYLERQMKEMRYDLKAYLRVLYNTKTYQRQSMRGDVPMDQAYHYPGPALRRMTAEQLWDSLLTVSMPDVDLRKSRSDRYNRRLEEMKEKAEELLRMKPNEILKMAEPVADVNRVYDEKTSGLRKQLAAARESNNDNLAKSLQDQMKAVRKERDKALKDIREAREAGNMMMGPGPVTMASMSRMRDAKQKDGKKAKEENREDRWKGYPDDYLRASELRSPAPSGHFLSQFGQSDRETIENSHQDPSVAQALTLLNGPVFDRLVAKNSVLTKTLAVSNGEDDKQDVLFLTLLSRRPTDAEREIMRQQFSSAQDADAACHDIVWALLNTREFAFVQ